MGSNNMEHDKQAHDIKHGMASYGRHAQHTTYNIQRAYDIHTTYNLQHTAYNIQHATYNIHEQTTYSMQHSCNTGHATSPVDTSITHIHPSCCPLILNFQLML